MTYADTQEIEREDGDYDRLRKRLEHSGVQRAETAER